jgi:predicted lysophospholipase L1 biosynthesis ABC-type transport system permease subunit
VRRVLGDRNPIGRRIRYLFYEEDSPGPIPVAERGPWYEIIGVVRDLGMAGPQDPKISGIYHPARIDSVQPAQIAVHVRGNAETFVPKLRRVAAEIDPSIRLYDIAPLSRAKDAELASLGFWFRLLLGVCAVALVLSLAGIYAVMSFTVSRRTREIGIRVALGASQGRVITAIFRRPLVQITVGVVAGLFLLMALSSMGNSGPIPWKLYGGFTLYATFMLGVCLLACIVPTMRALRVEPTEALRQDG